MSNDAPLTEATKMSTATTTFKKGQNVTLMQNWDNAGTVAFRDAVVYSCGKKQMVLTCAVTGEELGRHFSPVQGCLESVGKDATFPRMTETEAVEACLVAGSAIVAMMKELAERVIESGNEKGGNTILSELHAPNALNRTPSK